MSTPWAEVLARHLAKHMRDEGLDALDSLAFSLANESLDALTRLGDSIGDAVASERASRRAYIPAGQS